MVLGVLEQPGDEGRGGAAVDARGANLYECQAAALRRGPVAGQVELELVVRDSESDSNKVAEATRSLVLDDGAALLLLDGLDGKRDRLQLAALERAGEDVVGHRTRVKVVKNKVAPPFKQVEFDIMYGEGISKTGELIDLGVKAGVVEIGRAHV